MAAEVSDVFSWTNQDLRESQLFNVWGILYRERFSAFLAPLGRRF